MVFIADNDSSGHHKLYYDELLKIDGVELLLEERAFRPRSNIFGYFTSRIGFVRRSLKEALKRGGGKGVLHFLYLDALYVACFFMKLKKRGLRLTATLHQLPQNAKKMGLLKKFARKLDSIVVHSEYIKAVLLSNNIENVEVIDYPVFHSLPLDERETIRSREGLTPGQTVLSALGGTRHDKGLDILLESFKYLAPALKERLFLNVVGSEEHFKKDYILEMMESYTVKGRVKTEFLSDREFQENVVLSDLVVIPYRKYFNGNSGPMIEAVFRDIPVIGTDYGNLGALVRDNELGYTFEAEKPEELAAKLELFLKEGWQPGKKSTLYKSKLTVDVFRSSYEIIYRKLAGKR